MCVLVTWFSYERGQCGQLDTSPTNVAQGGLGQEDDTESATETRTRGSVSSVAGDPGRFGTLCPVAEVVFWRRGARPG